MHPVLFEIPGIGFPVRTFGVLVACGFLLALWVWSKLLARHGVDPAQDPERGSRVAMWILVGVLGGARLMYVGVESMRYLRTDITPGVESYLSARERGRVGQVLDPTDLETARRVQVGYDFLHDPLRVLFIWQGGLVMYGGFFGAILLGCWAARREGMNPWNALDTGLISGFAGQTLGRWGCLFVGDDYGSVVPQQWQHLPFPITLRVPSLEWLQAHPESLFDPSLADKVLWATQPWMSLNALLVALVGWLVLRRSHWHGKTAAWILVHYAVARFVIEMFRGDDVRGVWFGGALSTSQLISVPAVLLGLFLLFKNRKKSDPYRSWPPA